MHELPPGHQALEDWGEVETAALKLVALLNLVLRILVAAVGVVRLL
jgi:hypothetical protein